MIATLKGRIVDAAQLISSINGDTLRIRRLASLVTVAVAATGLASVTTAGGASAAVYCPSALYTFTAVTKPNLPTTTASAWLQTPGTISYTKTSSTTVSGSVTATVSAEAGVVFAKASASLGVTVGASQTWTEAFSYSKTSSASGGAWARLHLFHEARKFTVTKTVPNNICQYSVAYTATITVPVINGDDYWVMEYKN